MGFLVSALVLLIGLFAHRMNRTWINPTSMMCYLWSIVSFAAALRLFGLYDVSLLTWGIILVGIISFSFGTTIRVRIRTKGEYYPKTNVDPNCFISPRVYWILFAVLSIFIATNLKTSIDLMNKGYGLDVIRQATLGAQKIEGYAFRDSTFSYYGRYIKSALQAVLIASGIEFFFTDARKNLKYLIAVLFITIADAFSDGGRWIIMYTAIEFLVCYSLLKKRNGEERLVSISKKAKFFLVIGIIAMIVVMDKVTTARLGGGFIQHFYIYLCGCVPFLNTKIGFLQSNQYLTVVFTGQYGIWSFIAPYLYKITGGYLGAYSTAMEVVGNTQVYENIGTNQIYNAFVSCFYYLYADSRWIGVILGMLIFGIVAGNMYRKTQIPRSQGKMTTIVPYLIIAQMILKSIQSYPLAANTYVVTIIVLIIIFLSQNRRTRTQ